MRTITGLGRIVGGLVDVTIEGSPRINGRNPFVYCHSAVGTPLEFAGLFNDLSDISRSVVEQGLTCTLTPGRPASYGNPTAQSDLDATIAYARSTMGSSVGKVILMGSSMGSELIFAWALEHKEDIACIVVFNPVVDLNYVYENDILGQRSAVGTAWGVTHPTPLPEGAQYGERASELLGLPIKIYYGEDDPYNPPEIINIFSQESGAELVGFEGIGHDNAILSLIDMQDIIDFINLNVA